MPLNYISILYIIHILQFQKLAKSAAHGRQNARSVLIVNGVRTAPLVHGHLNTANTVRFVTRDHEIVLRVVDINRHITNPIILLRYMLETYFGSILTTYFK